MKTFKDVNIGDFIYIVDWDKIQISQHKIINIDNTYNSTFSYNVDDKEFKFIINKLDLGRQNVEIFNFTYYSNLERFNDHLQDYIIRLKENIKFYEER